MAKIKEITPFKLRCSVGGCEAVFITDEQKLVIIGKKLPDDLALQLRERVADDEFAIQIDIKYFQNLLEQSK